MNDLLALFIDGGPVMLPLLGLSLVIWGIIIFRFLQLRSFNENPYTLACNLVRIYKEAGAPAGRDYLQSQTGWLATRLVVWFDGEGTHPISGIMLEMRDYIQQPASSLLRALLQVAPLLGLLGTVAGMMETFDVLSAMGIASPAPLSGGIAQALITTQAGLSMALAGLFGTTQMESAATIRLHSGARAS
ncbi:hypothetical protein BVX99_02300 [bacterium F16]|nr:hypothetical protein BVX99_02300 [bacterium F16]